jgi:hypothetical protein
MIYYVIKHKPTGRYLPPGLGSGGRGFTHVEPVEGYPCLLYTSDAADDM